MFSYAMLTMLLFVSSSGLAVSAIFSSKTFGPVLLLEIFASGLTAPISFESNLFVSFEIYALFGELGCVLPEIMLIFALRPVSYFDNRNFLSSIRDKWLLNSADVSSRL